MSAVCSSTCWGKKRTFFCDTQIKQNICSPDLCVVEGERHYVVKLQIRILQSHFPPSMDDDEMLNWGEFFSFCHFHTECQCLWLSASTNNEILKNNYYQFTNFGHCFHCEGFQVQRFSADIIIAILTLNMINFPICEEPIQYCRCVLRH